VRPLLSNKARFYTAEWDGERKTYDYFLSTLERLIRSVYSGLLGGEFIDITANLIQGQIFQAYEQAWLDDGNLLPLPSFLQSAAEQAVLKQFDYVDQLYRDIVDARVDNTPIDPLIARAPLWANRFSEAQSNANALIALEMGGKLVWVEGDTKDKCKTCVALDGIVAYASIWTRLNVHPQGAPNPYIKCEGWNCSCQLLPTTERQTRDAEKRIMAAVGL
jgi:hypothetical protein